MADLDGNSGFEFGEFVLDVETKILRRNGEVVPLPLKAIELLAVLVENNGEVVSKDQLMERIWGDAFVEDSVLTQNIYILRKAFKSSGSAAKIKNIPRRGYVFEYELSEPESVSDVSSEAEGVPIDDQRSLHGKTTNSVPTEETGRHRPTRWVLAFSVFVVVFAAGFAGYRYLNGNATASIAAPGTVRLRPAGQPSALKIVAVLPFQGTDVVASANFARDLSIRLGSVNKFNVVPMQLIHQYEKFGAELRADLVLSGELTANEQRYSAVARLVKTADNSEVWSGRFEFDNIIQLQDAIANAAAKAVIDRMTNAERTVIAKRLPTNLSAYEHLQKGLLLWRDRREAEPFLTKAIELDASLAQAYAILAGRYAMAGKWTDAEQALDKAFALNDNLSDAYAVQGFFRIFHLHDWAGAETSLKSAVELDANNINARHWLGVFYSIHRRLDEAKVEMKTALELDPTNPTLLADIGQLYYFAGQIDKSAEYCRRALEIDPGHGFAARYLSEYTQPSTVDAETLLKEAEEAAQTRSFTLPYLNIDPRYEPVRSDPRFRQVMHSMGL